MFVFLLIFLGLALFLWYFSRADCDLELLWAEKYGHSIDKLKNKVIWVTGASSGIGEHLAYVLASAQAKLVLSGTRENSLQEVAEKCVSIAQYSADNVLVLPFNISDCECQQEMFDKVLARFGKLDILVNNAGRSQRSSFQDITPEVDRALFDINVFGLVNLTRIVLRYFLEHNRDGQFAVTSSTAGITGVPFSASYTGSKHALHGYFECLRTEIGTKGIAITMLCVGPVFSNLLDKVFTGNLNKKYNMNKFEADSRRMTTDRCAYLMAVSIVNKIDQAWIAIQPVLTMHYLSVYFPQIARKIVPRFFTPERAKKIRDGP